MAHELALLDSQVHPEAFEDRGERSFGGVDQLFAADKCRFAFFDFFAAHFAFLGQEVAAAVGDGSTARGHGGRESDGDLFERDERLLVVAGSKRAVGDVFDELRVKANVGPRDVGRAAAKVLDVQPQCGRSGRRRGFRALAAGVSSV